MSAQLSLFGDLARDPTVADVEGLLLGGGALARHGDLVRISVLTDADWRAEVLRQALDERGLAGEVCPTADHRTSVRSAFDARLTEVAARWTAGARTRVPARLVLTPSRLRFWATATGRFDGAGYVLGVGRGDEHLHTGIGAVLSASGLPGAFLGARAGGPAYRVVGTRRLARLRELAGPPPAGADPTCWPGS